MATTYSASSTVNISIATVYSKVMDLVSAVEAPTLNLSKTYSGSSITKLYQNSYSTSGTTTLDVTSLTDDYGQSISIGTLKGLFIKNTHATATLTVGGGTNPALGTDQYTISPDTLLPILSSWTISGSAKNIRILTSGTVTFQLILFGT